MRKLSVFALTLALGAGCSSGSGKYQAMVVDAIKSEYAAPNVMAEAARIPPAPLPAVAKNVEQPQYIADTAPHRLVIYSATVNLVVPDIAHCIQNVWGKANELGGYMQEMNEKMIKIRVPAAKFQETLSFVARLGEVTAQNVKSQDITEEMRDLNIRLENAQQTRLRLLELIKQSGKMEDMLKVEAELQRVTREVELLKGKINLLASQEQFSTIEAAFNSPLPQKQMVAQIPFNWVRRLGEGAVSGDAAQYAKSSSRDRREIQFDAPKSYIRYYDNGSVTEAMSADGVIMRFQKQDNYKGGDLDFWASLIRRTLVENRSVAFEKQEDFTSKNKISIRCFNGTRDLGNKKSGYLIAVAVEDDVVYTCECWGDAEAFSKDLPKLLESIKTLAVK